VRVGGFGGPAGLAAYLRAERIGSLVDATHPYAMTISANAVLAARAAGVPLLTLRRPPWTKVAGDRWTAVADMEGAVDALGKAPRRVFLALGRKEIGVFERAPQHFYLVRSVDPIDPPAALPDAVYVVARGPFDQAADLALLNAHAIDAVVSRNSGGSAAYAKIAAARTLGVEVVMVERPALPEAVSVATVAEALAWLDQRLASSTERGV